ncbi:MAG TPA: type VI secretion system tube protein Hcp [Bryobacteraceae bacterium]
MSVEIFLKLDGIEGESTKKDAENQIELFSFSNGASNPSSVSMGTGSGAGKVDLSSLSLQKQLDKASPKLFMACCKGTHIATGTMIVRESTGDADPKIYYQYDMKEVFVDSVSWGGAAGGGKPSESVSLSFKSIVISYWPQESSGTLGTKISDGWDVSTNTVAA